MNARTTGSVAICIISLFAACTKSSPGANGGAAQGGGGVLVPVLVGLGLAVLAAVAIYARVRAQKNATPNPT